MLKMTYPFDSMANVIVYVLFINNNITLSSCVSKIEYKNTSFRCIARYPHQPGVYFNNEDKIIIQGMFISSCILCILFYIQLKVHLHWLRWTLNNLHVMTNPPFTLQDIPILGYDINNTNINTGELLSNFKQTTSI